MPLLLIPILLGAIVFGTLRLYAGIAARFGPAAGVATVVLAVMVVVGLIMWQVRRYRLIHGKVVNGQRMLELPGDWGQLELDADKKQGSLTLHDVTTRFIFADIAGVSRKEQNGVQVVALQLRHADQVEWHIPFKSGKQAHRWERILSLAAAQKL